MLDGNDKIDLELILTLIRHIVLNDEVSNLVCLFSEISLIQGDYVCVCPSGVSLKPCFWISKICVSSTYKSPKVSIIDEADRAVVPVEDDFRSNKSK